MKKINLPRIKFHKLNISGFLNYVLTILISSIILALVLISLPLTERVTSSATYDLVNKNSLYWSKEYILELENILGGRNEDIENTKSIIQKRLRRYDIERSSVYSYTQDSITYIRVNVQTSKNPDIVDNLIRTPFILTIVTPKDDVDFYNPEDQLAQYLIENYDETEITRKDFRNIHITLLKNSTGEYSYFALFKTWPWENKWDTFLKDNAGLIIGIAIDGFVTPMQVPIDSSIFAVPISATEKESADLINILYNSGVIPSSYNVIDEIEIPIEVGEIDYIKITEGILIAVFLIYLYLLLIEKTPKEILIKSGLATVITISSWITYLKISDTPVDIFLLALHVIIIVAFLRIITENQESRIIVTVLTALLASVCILLGSGYIKIFADDLLILIILSNIALSLSSYYISNVRKSLKL